MIEHNGQILFSQQELECTRKKVVVLAPGFADELKKLRLAFDRPMTVNSCCRTPEYNTYVGGHPRSLHLTEGGRETGGTCAIDIGTRDRSSEYKAQLAMVALHYGWSVGVHPGFLHLDLRSRYTDLSQNIFNY